MTSRNQQGQVSGPTTKITVFLAFLPRFAPMTNYVKPKNIKS